MFIAGLLTIAKIWKQAKYPSADEWMKGAVVYLHNGILLSDKKHDLTLWNSTNGPGEHYGKWNKPVQERQVPYDFSHIWNVMNKIN